MAGALGVLLACRPPVPENEAPLVEILEPASGARLTAGTPFTLRVRLTDPDGDAPIAATVSESTAESAELTEIASAATTTSDEVLAFDGLVLEAGLRNLTVLADDGRPEGLRSALIGVDVVAGDAARAAADTGD